MSGSSGHLVIALPTTTETARSWPGQVFGETELSYSEVIWQYVPATQDRQIHSRTPRDCQVEAPTRWRQEWEGRDQRHQVLQRRQQEDADWKAAKAACQQARFTQRQLSKAQRKQQREAWQAEQAVWQELREQRHRQQQACLQENQAWHQHNRQPQEGVLTQPEAPNRIAILVVTANCTRQSLGLPVFRSGAKVTSQEELVALKCILPAELQFLISDQGKRFRTKFRAQLAQEEDFLHVLVYRHRPQSNGSAERFVLTFKNWLRDQPWQSLEESEDWIRQFQSQYNDRPHRGSGIPGLSPSEFAKRIWLL